MTVSLKIRVLYLIFKFFTHAFKFLQPVASARTVPARFFQTRAYHPHDLFVGIFDNFHCIFPPKIFICDPSLSNHPQTALQIPSLYPLYTLPAPSQGTLFSSQGMFFTSKGMFFTSQGTFLPPLKIAYFLTLKSHLLFLPLPAFHPAQASSV